MEATIDVLYFPEKTARQEMRSFVEEGLKDITENKLHDFHEVFDELEGRYR